MIERQAEHPRARTQAVAAHGRGLVLAARGDVDAAVAGSRRRSVITTSSPTAGGARTLLAHGGVLRRARRQREARPRSTMRSRASSRRVRRRSPPARATSSSGSAAAVAAGLTPTESRVAGLVAEGLSNKEVATELVVSVNAVEAHLTRIYAKLGVHSRAQLVRSLAKV